jgi:hypothetical protein
VQPLQMLAPFSVLPQMRMALLIFSTARPVP